MNAKKKLNLPRAPLPRQTEKVHSARKKPLPPIEVDVWEALQAELEEDEDYRFRFDPGDEE